MLSIMSVVVTRARVMDRIAVLVCKQKNCTVPVKNHLHTNMISMRSDSENVPF